MSATVAVGGWLAALGAATAWRIAQARRMEPAACASQEAIDLELGSAGHVLAGLGTARQGARAGNRRQTFALAGLLDEAADAYGDAAWARGRRLLLELPPASVLLHGDRQQLAEAIAELLDNALEHGGGAVQLLGRASQHTVRIEVLDEGPGLPASIVELTRRPRVGGDLHTRGLVKAADVAARYRGRLAEAPCEHGARLVLELPTAPQAAARAADS